MGSSQDSRKQTYTHLPDTRKHVRFSIIIPVGAHAQIHLLAVGVSLKGFCDSQDGIWGSHLHMGPPGTKMVNTKYQSR